MNKNSEIEILNELLTKAKDAEQGYEQAADHCKDDANLTSFFTRQSSLRFTLGKELEKHIQLLGGTPETSASVAAKAHQVWIAVKGFVTGGDNLAILEECERGEEAALKSYDDAIAEPSLSEQSKSMLREHRERVAEALTHIHVKEAVA